MQTFSAAAESDERINSLMGPEMRKFSRQISNTMLQVTGGVRLALPAVHVADPAAVIDDFEVVNAIEAAVEQWTPAIAHIVESQGEKQPIGDGPLAAIEFWRDRNAALSAVFEQLNTNAVKKLLEVLRLCESQAYPAFDHQYTQLNKMYQEAKVT